MENICNNNSAAKVSYETDFRQEKMVNTCTNNLTAKVLYSVNHVNLLST